MEVAYLNFLSMWIRNVIWSPSDLKLERVRGSYMESVFDLDEDDAIETAGLDVPGLEKLLPSRGEELTQQGTIVLDAVIGESQEEEGEIAELLELLCPLEIGPLLEHVMGRSRILGVETYTVLGDDVKSVNIDFRSIDVPEFAFPGGKHRDPHIVTRSARLLLNEQLLLIFWGSLRAVPALPPPEEVDGEQMYSLDLSADPPAQRTKLGAWGGWGAEAFDTVLLRAKEKDWHQPLVFTERWLSMVVSDLAEGARDMEASLRLWELDVHKTLDRWEHIQDQFGTLARFGALIGLLESIRADIGGPQEESSYWFPRTEENPEIVEDLRNVEQGIEVMRGRLRDATALVSAVMSANALSLQQKAQERSEQLQHAVTTISAAVLGPALIFGLFGANVHVPLEGSWWGFLLMVGLAFLSIAVIRIALSRMSN